MNNIAANARPMRARSTLGIFNPFGKFHQKPIVWSIAGSDSGAGAGLQADLKAFQAFGVHGCTAVAAITAQNSVTITHIEPVSAALLDAQLAALASDMPPQAIKTGLLGSVDNVRVVCRWVDCLRSQGQTVDLVVDPVLRASTGASFANEAIRQAYIEELLPRATLVTPNRQEAEQLGLMPLGFVKTANAAMVITGGDADDTEANDWLNCAQITGWLRLPRVETSHHHGTGCTFAATAAAALASGYCVADAVILAKMATTHALRHSYALGQGAGAVQAMPDFAQHIHNLPFLSSLSSERPTVQTASSATSCSFPRLRHSDLGVYAVVDSADWVRRVLAAGIRTVQLRIKNSQAVEKHIQEAIAFAREVPEAQLFINDHWQLALQYGAYGVHLGQEDLDTLQPSDWDTLRRAGVRLGISTHSYWEVARAWALQPSYIACGPIFATQSKDMPWIPQGLDNLRYWANVLPLPVVGIAGIHAGNIGAIAATGAASAAVITAITHATDPEVACHTLQIEWERKTWEKCNGKPY